MALVKITDLEAAAQANMSDLLETVQEISGVLNSRKVSLQQIASLFAESADFSQKIQEALSELEALKKFIDGANNNAVSEIKNSLSGGVLAGQNQNSDFGFMINVQNGRPQIFFNAFIDRQWDAVNNIWADGTQEAQALLQLDTDGLKISTDNGSTWQNLPTAAEIETAIDEKIETHNADTDAHADIRQDIADTIAASQKWLSAVETLAELTTPADTDKTYLCRVVSENNVYQWAAGDTQWRLYSENTDYIDEDELDDAISAHNTNTSAHADIRTKIGADISAHNTNASAHADIRDIAAGSNKLDKEKSIAAEYRKVNYDNTGGDAIIKSSNQLISTVQAQITVHTDPITSSMDVNQRQSSITLHTQLTNDQNTAIQYSEFIVNPKIAGGAVLNRYQDVPPIADNSLMTKADVTAITNPIQTQVNAKQDTLVSGTNIKSINGTSLLGAGNLVLSTNGLTVYKTGASNEQAVQIYHIGYWVNGSAGASTPPQNVTIEYHSKRNAYNRKLICNIQGTYNTYNKWLHIIESITESASSALPPLKFFTLRGNDGAADTSELHLFLNINTPGDTGRLEQELFITTGNFNNFVPDGALIFADPTGGDGYAAAATQTWNIPHNRTQWAIPSTSITRNSAWLTDGTIAVERSNDGSVGQLFFELTGTAGATLPASSVLINASEWNELNNLGNFPNFRRYCIGQLFDVSSYTKKASIGCPPGAGQVYTIGWDVNTFPGSLRGELIGVI